MFSNGTLRISDFGAAAAFDAAAPLLFARPAGVPPRLLAGSPWASGTAGTEAFWPPEVCRGRGGDLRLADAWAAGCCLSCLAFGALPFDPALPTALLMDAIAEQPPNLPPPPLALGVGGAAKEWWLALGADDPGRTPALLALLLGDQAASGQSFGGLLAKDPQQRPSLQTALAHPWFAQVAEDAPLAGAVGP